MTIATADLHWYRSALTSDATPAANGGRLSTTEAVSGVKNNVFPDSSVDDRASGIEYFRKLFLVCKNSGNLEYVDPKVSIQDATPGDSHTLLYPGTLTDTQDSLTARPYAFGTLNSAASADDTSIVITTEADFSALSSDPFQVGDKVRIDARADVLSSGLFEYRTIASVSVSGDQVTIGIDPLVNDYDAGAQVASVYEPSSLSTSVTGKSVTGGVTYDDTTYPITVPQIGARYATWTITVTNAASGTLSYTSDTTPAITGTGAQGANLSPANPNGGTYFTVPAAGWGGTASDGDTLVFTTVPACAPIWLRRVIPAGADAISPDTTTVCVEGESA